MLKFLFYFNLIVIFINLNEAKFNEKGGVNGNGIKDEVPWPNAWFPYPPNYEKNVKSENVNVAEAPTAIDLTNRNNSSNWTGLLFPHPPDYQNKLETKAINTPSDQDLSAKKNTSDWPGLWFPMLPNYGSGKLNKQNPLPIADNTGKNHECDNGKDNIAVDFDPEDEQHSFNYICIGNRSAYDPNLNTSALLKKYIIPAAYEPPEKCLFENLDYSKSIPTFGGFRPRAPKFGSYKYLPPQRWLHSLADGAIVLLYHPCAFGGQIERLQTILKGCLYRHIITPSQQLAPERPLALIAWGKSLEMSVVDSDIVVKFIKENAKMGFRRNQQKLQISQQLYDAGLLTGAHLVTDEQDTEICGYSEMR